MTDPTLRPRRGAHRAPRRPLARLAPWIGALVVLAVVIGLAWTLGRDDDPVTTDEGGPATTATPPVPSVAPSSAPPPSPIPTPPPPTAGTGTEAPARDRFEVVVLNQTRRAGLAATVAEALRADGWNVASTGNFGGMVPETTVYFPAGGEPAATELAARLPVTPRVRPVFPAIDAERLTVIITDNYP